MKKLITGILATTLALSCFVGCGETEPPVTTNPLQEATSLLEDMYKKKDVEVRADYEVLSQLIYDGATYTITWTTDVESVKITEIDGKVYVDIDEDSPVDVTYKLTATLTDAAGNTDTVTFERVAKKGDTQVPSAITASPVEETEYKLYMYQGNTKQNLYFAGDMTGYYGLTTEEQSEAVSVYAEYAAESTTEFYLWFNYKNAETDTTEKRYISVEVSGTHLNFTIEQTTPLTKFVYSTEYGTFITVESFTKDNATEPCYVGTYETHDTYGASQVHHAATGFVGKLVTMVDKSSITPEVKVAYEKTALSVTTSYSEAAVVELPTAGATYSDVAIAWTLTGTGATLEGNVLTIADITAAGTLTLTATLTVGEKSEEVTFEIKLVPASNITNETTLVADKAYKFYVNQVTLGKTIYITGEVSGRYLATTENASEGADVYAEVVEGGYKFYIMNGTEKAYINIYNNDSNKLSVNFAATTESVFAYNATCNCWAAQFNGETYYLGTYNDFNTISASKISYITADNTGVEQFPANFTVYTASEGGNQGGDVTVGTPATTGLQEGVAYIVSANNADGPLYLKGTITSGRFDCSKNISEAVYVYVENVTGGQLLYMLNGTEKTYFVFADKAAGGSTTTDANAATVFEWNATLCTLVVAEDSNNRAFGAGKTSTYTNFSAYDASQTDYNWGAFSPVNS